MSLKTDDVEILLGPEPASPSFELERLIPQAEEKPVVEETRSRLSKMYDHPSLKWPSGERPKIMVD